MRISDWSSDVCSSDLRKYDQGQHILLGQQQAKIIDGKSPDQLGRDICRCHFFVLEAALGLYGRHWENLQHADSEYCRQQGRPCKYNARKQQAAAPILLPMKLNKRGSYRQKNQRKQAKQEQ